MTPVSGMIWSRACPLTSAKQRLPHFPFLLHVFFSDHLIMCLPVIAEPLSGLFTAMIRHSFLPKLLWNCTLVPIPKSGKDPSDSSSYRAIALAPTLSKALEWCLLLQFPDQFS